MASVSGRRYPADPKCYKLHEEIGEGVSGTVYRALCIPFNEIVAVKVIDLEKCDTDLDGIQREVQTMSLISHPNILQAHCSFMSDTDLWVVMPYLAGGSCLHIMRFANPEGFEEPVIATLLREVLKALVYLHLQGRIHRDIKAGNILIGANGAVKLADFGVSACMFDSGDRLRARNSFVGTPCWMAPEVMEQNRAYDFKADIWSFGITALELAHGHAPLSKYPPMKVLLLTLQNAPPGLNYERDKRFSKSFREMIAACLVKDPKKRLTAEKLLKHSFFKNARSSEYLAREVVNGLAPLGERFRKLKAKDIELLLQDKAVNGDEKHIPKQEYMHGISNWKFDLEELKAQAALMEESDALSATEDPYTDLAETTDTSYSENVSHLDSEIVREDDVLGNKELEDSLAFSFPMLPIQALKGCFDVCEDEISPETPDLKDASRSHFSLAENLEVENYENASPERSITVTPSISGSAISQDLIPSIDVTGDIERNDQEHRLQSGRNTSTPVSHHQRKDSRSQFVVARESAEEKVVQQKGRFRVTAPDTPKKVDGLNKVQDNVVTGSRASSANTAFMVSSLQHLLQQTGVQREQLVKLIKHLEQNPVLKKNLDEAAKQVRERDLQSYAAHLQKCNEDLFQEVQKVSVLNAQLERKLAFSLSRKKSGKGNEVS